MEKFVQPMLHGKDRCFRGMTRHKVEIRGKTKGVVAPQSHTCLKLSSLWKSHYRVFQAEVPRGVAGTSFAITIVATAEA